MIKRSTKTTLIILGVIAAFGIGFSVFYYASPTLFTIREVVVSGGGSPHLTEKDVLKLSGVSLGENLFRLKLNETEAKLKRFSWVKEAYLIKQYPHRFFIRIKEYTPIAIVQMDHWYYISASGKLFKRLSPEDSRNYPVLTGLSKDSIDPNVRAVQSLQFLKAFNLIDKATQFGVSEIHWSPSNGFLLYTLRPAFQIQFGSQKLPERLMRWKEIGTVLANQYAHQKKTLHVDMTYDERVYIKFSKTKISLDFKHYSFWNFNLC